MKSPTAIRLATLACILCLSACSSSRFEADVVRFHALDSADIGAGKTLTIAPMAAEDNGLAFSAYADIVGKRLSEFGFTPAQTELADYVALIDFNITRRQNTDDGRNSPVSVGVGVGGVGRNVGVSVGTAFGVGTRKPREFYNRELFLQLKDAATATIIYEGRVSSDGQEKEPLAVLPLMLDALFEEFPGPNGSTTKFETKLPQGQ